MRPVNTATADETLIIDATAPLIAIDGAAHVITNNPTRPITGTTDQPAGSLVHRHRGRAGR